MGITNIRAGKLIYHLTKLKNLDSILENGLLPRKFVKEYNLNFSDVADLNIISKRTELGLDIYTPFHFHPYSSFDVAVKSKYSDEEFIYLCISRDIAEFNNFKVLPRHPLNLEDCILMDYEEGFKAIDWRAMHTYGTEDEYTKHVKMAECLTERRVTVNLFQCIYVKNEQTKKLVEKRLIENGIEKKPPYVSIAKWL